MQQLCRTLVGLMCAWLNTSAIPGASREQLLAPLTVALDTLSAHQESNELHATLRRLWQQHTPPVACDKAIVDVCIDAFIQNLFLEQATLLNKRAEIEQGCSALLNE